MHATTYGKVSIPIYVFFGLITRISSLTIWFSHLYVVHKLELAARPTYLLPRPTYYYTILHIYLFIVA